MTMNFKKYENVHQFTDDVINSKDSKGKIMSGNSRKNIDQCIIYKDANKEKEIIDNEDPDDKESLCSNINSVSESEITNVTTRSLSTEFSSFSLHERNMLDTNKMKSQVNIMKFYDRNKLQLVSSRKMQYEMQRANKTFTIAELMKIERENRILMEKILKVKKPQNKIKSQHIPTTSSYSAINRKKIQRKIEEENMILLKKIRQARPHVILHSNLTN